MWSILDELGKSGGDLPQRQNEIRETCRDCAARHGCVFGLIRFLDQNDAPGFLDRFDPKDPSAPAPVRTMAKSSRRRAASERKKISIGARCQRGSSNSVIAR